MIATAYKQVPVGDVPYGIPAAPFNLRGYRPYFYANKYWCVHHVTPEGGGLFEDVKQVFKSVDFGQTWQPVVEITNAATPAYRIEFWSDQLPNLQYIFLLYRAADDRLTIGRFDCGSDLMDLFFPSTDFPSSFVVYDFFVRSDQSFIICGRQDDLPAYVTVATDGTWGPVTQIPLEFTGSLFYFGLGAANRLHVVAIEEPSGGTNRTNHVSVEYDGTVNTVQSLNSTDNFSGFSNMVRYVSGGNTYMMIWGKHDAPGTAASFHAQSVPNPTWVRTETVSPPGTESYDLTGIDDAVMAVSPIADGHGAEYLLFYGNAWTEFPTQFWGDPVHTFLGGHGSNIGGEYSVVFRSAADSFYHFLVAPEEPDDVCYQDVRLPPVRELDPRYTTWTGDGHIKLTESVHNGPWRIGGDLYMSGYGATTYSAWAHIFRSKNNGRTWKVQDAAQSFTTLGIAHYDEARGVITVLHVYDGAGGVRRLAFKDFDPATNQWGTRYALGGPQKPTPWEWVLKPNGQKMVFFQDPWDFAYYPTTDQLYFAVWSEETGWMTPQVATDNNADTTSDEIIFSGATVDPATGNVHLTWTYSANYGGAKAFYHRIIFDDLTMGPATLLAQNTGTNVLNEKKFPVGPPTVIFNDKVYVMFCQGWPNWNNRPTGGYYYAMEGSPASEPDTWTKRKIASLAVTKKAGMNPDEMDIGAVVKGGKLIFLYNDWTGPSGHIADTLPIVDRIYQVETADGEKYSMPELFYDFWGTSSAGLYCINITDIGSGMADGLGVFGFFTSGTGVACGLYKCRGGGAGNYAF